MVAEPGTAAVLRDAGAAPAAVGTLLGIARRIRSRAPMELLSESLVTPELGVIGDYRGRAKPNGRPHPAPGLGAAARGLGRGRGGAGDELPWTMRRANLMVEGVAIPRRRES
jgi:hypothetical protein